VRKKLLILAVISILLIAIPLVIATVTNSQTINVSGTARYPNLPPTPDPTATPAPSQSPTASISYSLTLSNGTAYPATLDNFPLIVEVDNGPIAPTAVGEVFNVTNTCNVPINMTMAATNVNLPSNLGFNLAWGNYDGGSLTVGVGQSITMWFIPTAYPSSMYYPNGTLTYTPGATFSYSFDIVITGTQA
jgi:hypothetical protein